LADQPFVTADAWRAVTDADPDCRVVVATYDGRPGPHPVRLHRDVWPLLPTEGDEGARSLLEQHPEWRCRVPCLGSADDIDTVEDLARWKSC
jgi:molybdenum cofactor cytidylyltransferase